MFQFETEFSVFGVSFTLLSLLEYNFVVQRSVMKKRINTILMSLLGILLLSGCIHRELIISGPSGTQSQTESNTTGKLDEKLSDGTVIPRIAFPVEEYRRFAKTGNGTVKGVIYLADAYGKRIYGKQTRLYLNPVTSYSKQWYQESYIGGYKMEKADKRLYNYLKFTASNAQGKFAFYGVPSGSYYVVGIVKCAQECGYDTPHNIRVAKEVTVSGSETATVELSRMIDREN